MIRKVLPSLLFVCALVLAVVVAQKRSATPGRMDFASANGRHLVIEMISERVFQFHVTLHPDLNEDFPLIEASARLVPSLKSSASGFETSDLAVAVVTDTLCMNVFDKRQAITLALVCP